MRMKLVWLFGIVILALVGLSLRITYINASEGNKYKKQVLSQSQQKYDSKVIPFQRGSIEDRNGVVLATSEKVYKIILDCKVVNSNEKYIEPTIKAMVNVLGLDETLIREKLEGETTKSSQYQIMKINVPITDKKAFEDYIDTESEEFENLTEEEQIERRRVKGVWFEDDYLRTYPLGSTACDLIGFTYTGNAADWGIEGYYSSTLNGINGRQYGYFNEDADVEQTIIEPVNGNSIISTIDINIQQIVEKHIQNLMIGMAYGPNGDEGAKNVGVIVMDPNNGEVLAMATNNPYDLNEPRNLEPFFSDEEITAMDDATTLEELNKIWKNYCISDAFEPGSTVKPLTIAGALQTNAILSSDVFMCDGYEAFVGADKPIKCIAYPGAHGEQTLSDLIKNSCNDGLMQIAEIMGYEDFLEYQKIFNFGSTTGIDLPGESAGIIHTENQLSSKSTELATSSFGQSYNCTMIQEIAAISSVINGGNYYQPHVVSKILDDNNNVVKNVEPILLKQTVSSEISSLTRQYMGAVMASDGTGYAAKVDGYSMGGKTGTAEKLPRGNGKYLVSFIGFAPLDNPEVVVYVVVDEPNASFQADSKYAQYLYKQIMTEILPYLNIFPDEEITGKEDPEMTYFINQLNERIEKNRQKMAMEAFREEMGLDDDTQIRVDAEGNFYAEQIITSEDTDSENDTASSEEPKEDMLTQEEGISENTDDINVPEPPVSTEETILDNKYESDGITNDEAIMENGQ